MTQRRQRLGARGEELAARHLRALGARVLARRFRVRGGELDLVVIDPRGLAFVEVKARSGRACGDGSEAVTLAKRRRICHAARVFLVRHPELADVPCRFAVVSVMGPPGREAVHLIDEAFDAIPDRD